MPTGVQGPRADGLYEVHDFMIAASITLTKLDGVAPITNVAQFRTTDGQFIVILSNPHPDRPELGFAIIERARMAFASTREAAADLRVAAYRRSAVTIPPVRPATSPTGATG